MIIAIDFDGTCVTHEYPPIGKDIGAIPVLQQLTQEGHKLILYTMRSESTLEEAVNWFKANDIPLWGINENPEQKNWTASPKVYAQLYIDDAALGCPLLYPVNGRPFVHWNMVKYMLTKDGILHAKEETSQEETKEV